MSSSILCDFDVSVQVIGDGLMGADKEYNPYFMAHATFGNDKVKDEMPLQLVASERRQLRPYQFRSANNKNSGETLYDYDDKLNTWHTSQPKNFRLEHQGAHLRVDESVNMELWCHTRLSGIAELDKRESRYAERQVSCGLFQLSVAQIIGLYKQNKLKLGQPFVVEASLVDDKIIEAALLQYIQADGHQQQVTRERYNQYVARAIDETHKAKVRFEIRMNAFSEELYVGSVFHIENFQARTCWATSAPPPVNTKVGSSTLGARGGGHGRSGGGGRHRSALHPPDVPMVVVYSPSDPQGEQRGNAGGGQQDFQPLSHTSALGYQKMQECMQQCVLSTYCRAFMQLDAQAPAPLWAPADDVVKNLQFPQWRSKMGNGLAISYFSCHDPSTRVYASEAAKLADLQRYGFNADTERHFLMMAQSALRSRGLTAQVFEQEVRAHFSSENRSRQLSPLFALCEEVVARLGTFAANSAYYTADYRMVRQLVMGAKAKMIVLDSWDNTLLNGSGRSDDCEGQDNTATTIIRAFGTGRHELGFKWESSLLDAIQLYLQHTVIYDIGGTVTSAFLNNSNEAVDMRKTDLPMNDDAMDRRSKSDGHCFGLMESQTNCIKRLAQGNIGATRLGLIQSMTLQDEAFQARDALRPGLLLEGTGTTEPRILPLDETYASNDLLRQKKLSERLFVRSIQSRLKERKEQLELQKKQTGVNTTADISGMFHGEGMPHYVKVQHPERRISDFYKQAVMGCSVELYQRFGIAGSQFAFTRRGDDGQHRYGVRVADFLRTTERHALVFPFADCSSEWVQRVTQLTECVQHQLPLMAFGRYSAKQYVQTHSQYVRGSEASQQAFESLVYSVATNPQLSVARLQTRQGELNLDATRTGAMFDFIAQSPGLKAFAVYREGHLPPCDDIVEILCVVDNQVCLGLAQQQD